jgi:hypothetical protein
MAGPDPDGVTLGEGWPDRIVVWVELATTGNRKARVRRAEIILHFLRRGGWLCRWCFCPVPLHRRADAVFCREGCRKRAARQRRLLRKPE